MAGDVLDEVRRLIADCGHTRYSIAKATGIPAQQLHRLMQKDVGLSLASLQRLLAHLGYEIKLQKRG
ncbi:MAG: helix-turn-helix domain-containing protein [Planctomyces sp.]